MKATVEKIGNLYEVTGLREIGENMYESSFLQSLSNSYKTLNGAIKAIKAKGYEYVDRDSIQMVDNHD